MFVLLFVAKMVCRILHTSCSQKHISSCANLSTIDTCYIFDQVRKVNFDSLKKQINWESFSGVEPYKSFLISPFLFWLLSTRKMTRGLQNILYVKSLRISNTRNTHSLTFSDKFTETTKIFQTIHFLFVEEFQNFKIFS